jgi:thioredoxin 1
MALHLTQDNIEKEVNQSKLPVVIDVYAVWCGPCQQIAPIFEEVEKELSSSYKFAKINVDEARELSIRYGVTSVPTFIFIKDGKVMGKETGYMPKEDLIDTIKKYLG